MNARALLFLSALSCVTYGCGRPAQNETASTPPLAPEPTKAVSATTNAIQPGIDSSAAFTRLLEQRWPLESIHAFCIPERRHNMAYQLLVVDNPYWHGTLYEGRETGFDEISWAADIENGRVSGYRLTAQTGTNFWLLDGGTPESLKKSPDVTPDWRANWFVGHK